MEENQPENSPLAAFPNEHPVESPTSPHHPFYRSKMVIIGSLLVLLLLGFVGGYTILGNQQQTPSKKVAVQPSSEMSPTPTISAPTPKAVTADVKSYSNTFYAYELKYAQNTNNTEANTAQYGYTEFGNGCFKVYAVPKGTEDTLTEKQNDIPWKQLDDLKSLPVGEKKNCSVLTFTFGEDNKAVVSGNYYTKLPMKTIAGVDWYAFEVDNSLNPDSKHNIYFVEKGTYTYVIDMLSGGACPTTENNDMLTTFKFTQ